MNETKSNFVAGERTAFSRSLQEFPFPRRYTRQSRRLKVEVRTTIRYRSYTKDLSEDGMCFEIPEQLAAGREVTAWIFLDQNPRIPPIQARCRVVWHDKGNRACRHGAQFRFFSRNGLDRLQEFLASA